MNSLVARIFAFVALLVMPALASAVALNVATAPSTGVSGVSNVNINGSGFPVGTILPSAVTITLSTSCGGAVAATTPALSVTTITSSVRRIQFHIPSALVTGTYFASLSGSTTTGTAFSSTTCSQVNVTASNPTLSACVPTSSLGINAPTSPGPVTAIVPRGAWGGGTTGIRLVSLEGPGVNASISTPDNVNSCAANPATGQSVCVANTNNVYLINSAGVLTNTLVSGSNAFASFSGGSCKNCGVAINALTNQAVIAMGLSGPSNSGLQVLDLNTNTFSTPLPLQHIVSEDISIDPTRGFILSPNENNRYDLIQFNSTTGALGAQFTFLPSGVSGEFDSAAEDCSTGIALASQEFSSNVFIVDLTQATFTPGSPIGTWTAPSQSVPLAGSFSAGTSGISVAPGGGHLAVVTGEFGGSAFAVLQLPSTSGSGTPNIVDYAYVSSICSVNAGLDPHTISAYTSPNDGRAYAVMASGGPPPNMLAVLDLAAILAAPRNPASHTISGGTICPTTHPTLVRFVSVP